MSIFNARDIAAQQAGALLDVPLGELFLFSNTLNCIRAHPGVSGELNEPAIGDFLHKAGIGGKTRAGPPTAAKPLPALAPTLPEHYSGDLQWPLEAGIVSSEFGQRWGKLHKGIDIAADVGEPVYAIADGDVIYASDGMQGYGNVVILYAHNSALKVKVGDHVNRGSLVALLGSTGHSTGPHVHFEIRDGDNPVDPRTALPPSKLADTDDPAVDSPRVAQLRAR